METCPNTGDVVVLYRKILQVASDIQGLDVDWFYVTEGFEWNVQLLRARLDFYEQDEGRHVYEKPVDNSIVETLKRAEESLKMEERKLSLLQEGTRSDRCCGIFSQICLLVAKVSTISLPERLEITLCEVLNVMATSKSNLQIGANIGDVVVLYRKILQVSSDIQGLKVDWFSVTEGFEWKVQLLRARLDFYEQDEGRHVYEKPVDNSIVETMTRAEESLKMEERKLRLLQEGTRSDRCCGIFSQICLLVAKVSTISLPERLEITLCEVLNVMATSKSNLLIGADIGDVVVLYSKILQVASDICKQGLKVDWFSVTEGFEGKVQLLRERIDFYQQEEGRHVLEKPVDDSIVKMLERAEVSLNIEERKLELLSKGTKCCRVFSHWCVLVAKGSTISLPAKLEVTLGEVLNVLGTSDSVLKMEGETADWSLVATMLNGFKSLETADAKVLLFLIYACKEGPVPGEVLRNLYYATRPSNTFFLSIKELRARKLVERRPSTLAPETWKGKERPDEHLEESMFSVPTLEQLKIGSREMVHGDWSMPSAVKRCITDKEEIRYVLGVLFGGDQSPADKHDRSSEVMETEKTRVTKALCNLYFDSALIEQVGNPVTTSDSYSVHDDVMTDERWRGIEPLIWLLDQPTDKVKWTESDISCVRKVLLKYIHEGQLDDANISVLLKLPRYPEAPLATLATIANIFSKEKRPLLNGGFLNTLVNLLDSKELSLRAAAATALLCITRKAKKDQATFIDANMLGILAKLVRSIQDYDLVTPPHGAHELSLNATRILWSLGRMEIIKLKMYSEDKAIESLVQSLERDDSPLQQCAAGALWRLACGEEAVKLKIVNDSGALAGLVRSLYKIKDPTLQEYAAGALMSLATGGELIKSRILDEDGALHTIVKCLSITRYDPARYANLEKNLATILENLTFGGESIIKKILENDRALAVLVQSLSRDDNPILQETAASALLNLAVGGEAIKYKVLTGNGVLTSLVKSLTNDGNPVVVESAARALWSLTYGGKSTKLRIARLIKNQDGALKCLVQALCKDGEPMLQQNVALVLGNLATTKSGREAIVETEGALASLVKSLSRKDNPSLQGNAAGALWILAAQGETNKVCKEEGAIAGLVGFISNHDNLNVSRNAIGALLALAARGKVSDLSKEEGALDALKRFLSQDDHSTLQHKATRDLFNQAIGGESTKSKIREDLKMWDYQAHREDGVAPESIKDVAGAAPESTKEVTGAAPESTKEVAGAAPESTKEVAGAAPESSKGFDSETNTLEKEKMKEAIIHCALYFDQVGTHIMVDTLINQARHAHEVIHSEDPINDQRRKTLEPLIPLLDQPKEEEENNQALDQPQEEHNQETARWVKQVFLKYVCEGQLDDRIFDLLKKAPLVTLKVITNIFLKEEGPLLHSNGQKLLDDVKQLLGSNDDSQRGVQEAASEALLHIFRKYMKEDPTFVVKNKPGISGMLLRSIDSLRRKQSDTLEDTLALRRKQSDTLASNAAKILCLLGCSLICTPK